MHTVERRVYDTDDQGRRRLLYRPGDSISDAEAKRVATLVEPKPGPPGLKVLVEHGAAPADEAPAKPLDRMKLDELRAVCEVEGISPGDANTRAEYREKIVAGREAVANSNER